MAEPFKKCPHCHHRWMTRDDLLSDPDVSLIGYQANLFNLKAGYFLFNHDAAACETSLAVRAKEFLDLHDGPVFDNPHGVVDECPGYCEDHRKLEVCTAKCQCAFVRDVVQKVRRWQKKPGRKGGGS